MSRWEKYSGATARARDDELLKKRTREWGKRRTLRGSSAQIAHKLLTSLDEDAPRIDVSPAPLTPRRTRLAKVHNGYRTFLLTKLSERLNDEPEGKLRSEGEIVGSGEVVGSHADEAGVAIT
jgi:hypothetical protein